MGKMRNNEERGDWVLDPSKKEDRSHVKSNDTQTLCKNRQ